MLAISDHTPSAIWCIERVESIVDAIDEFLHIIYKYGKFWTESIGGFAESNQWADFFNGFVMNLGTKIACFFSSYFVQVTS